MLIDIRDFLIFLGVKIKLSVKMILFLGVVILKYLEGSYLQIISKSLVDTHNEKNYRTIKYTINYKIIIYLVGMWAYIKLFYQLLS